LEIIGNIFDFICEKILLFFVAVTDFLVRIANQIMRGLGWLYGVIRAEEIVFFIVIGAIVLLGIIFIVRSVHKLLDGDFDDEDDEKEESHGKRRKKKEFFGTSQVIEDLPIPGAERIAGILAAYKVIMIILYYPCAFFVGLLCTLAGEGDSTAFFGGVVNEKVGYTFSNFLEWDEAAKFLCTFVLIKLAMKVISCLFTLDFLKLLRTVTVTVDIFLLGRVLGFLYLWMQEASEDSFILNILFLLPSFAIFLIYPFIMIGFLAPIAGTVGPLLALIIFPFLLLAKGGAEGEWEAAKTNALARNDILTFTAMSCAERGSTGMLLFLDVLGM